MVGPFLYRCGYEAVEDHEMPSRNQRTRRLLGSAR
jgi:hypothetical protein